jgi:hypothetical protein
MRRALFALCLLAGCDQSSDGTSDLRAPSCGDGQLGGDESDVDCGGSCPPCIAGQSCLHGRDCQSLLCINNVCAATDLSSADLGASDLQLEADLASGPDLMLSTPCPLRPMNEWHVSPFGSDTQTLYAGNGSATCPLKTIGRAITLARADTLSTTLFVHKGNVSPTRYGEACTGGPPCDGDLFLSSVAGQSITLHGDGTAEIVIATHGQPVIRASASESSDTITVRDLTIKPLLLGLPGTNQGAGLVVADKGRVVVTNLVVDGITPSASTPGTQNGILVYPASGSVTLGPGITVSGGNYGIQASGPAITNLLGTPTAPTLIQGSNVCVSGVSSTDGTITLQNCTHSGIDGRAVTGVVVSGGGDGTGSGIYASGTVAAVKVTGFAGDGLTCFNCTLANNVEISNNIGIGVHVTGGADISGLSSTKNQGDGLRCDGTATVLLRNSILNGNAGNGLLALQTCALDLGYVTVGGNNEFNRTSAKNGLSGLCLLQTNNPSVTASNSNFSCGATAPGCVQSGQPTTVMASTCQTADITLGPGAMISTPTSSCCD